MEKPAVSAVGFFMSAALLYIPHTPCLPLQFVQLSTGKACCHPHYRDRFKGMQGFFGFLVPLVSHKEP